jgi:hypothetical protein
MITVYRIYLGQAWCGDDKAEALARMFDALPEFFYRTATLTADEAAREGATAESRRAAVRIAMTQAHIVLLLADGSVTSDPWTMQEIQVARSGLRQPIPILAVVPPGGRAQETLAASAANRVVGWNVDDIACAIVELVETAAAGRREVLRQLELEAGRRIADARQTRAAVPGFEAGADRALPVIEIAEAFAALKERRDGSRPVGE